MSKCTLNSVHYTNISFELFIHISFTALENKLHSPGSASISHAHTCSAYRTHTHKKKIDTEASFLYFRRVNFVLLELYIKLSHAHSLTLEAFRKCSLQPGAVF